MKWRSTSSRALSDLAVWYASQSCSMAIRLSVRSGATRSNPCREICAPRSSNRLLRCSMSLSSSISRFWSIHDRPLVCRSGAGRPVSSASAMASSSSALAFRASPSLIQSSAFTTQALPARRRRRHPGRPARWTAGCTQPPTPGSCRRSPFCQWQCSSPTRCYGAPGSRRRPMP
ncbi:hypothetical protein D3C84_900670 [compost metagenome]